MQPVDHDIAVDPNTRLATGECLGARPFRHAWKNLSKVPQRRTGPAND